MSFQGGPGATNFQPASAGNMFGMRSPQFQAPTNGGGGGPKGGGGINATPAPAPWMSTPSNSAPAPNLPALSGGMPGVPPQIQPLIQQQQNTQAQQQAQLAATNAPINAEAQAVAARLGATPPSPTMAGAGPKGAIGGSQALQPVPSAPAPLPIAPSAPTTQSRPPSK